MRQPPKVIWVSKRKYFETLNQAVRAQKKETENVKKLRELRKQLEIIENRETKNI